MYPELQTVPLDLSKAPCTFRITLGDNTKPGSARICDLVITDAEVASWDGGDWSHCRDRVQKIFDDRFGAGLVRIQVQHAPTGSRPGSLDEVLPSSQRR